ncbi:hypothetical protein COLO4_34622 [Corchorus olitorius]|uniref:DUF7787 domain-containing protein n=1 Tax=Corchorus olitorius TaxID=93759 RepID=A0A1R3GK71_9ROSI|nr:hypothetical protein COLO4_34622 [Corchorus olitorius]
MHGFKKIHKRRKAELYEALSTIDLIKPQRSTLKDDFPPYDDSDSDSALALDQVKQDLETLKWQECPVQSIQVIHPTVQVASPALSKGCDGVSTGTGSATSSFTISRKRQKSGRKRRVSAVYRGSDEQGNVAVGNMNDGVESGVARDHDIGPIQLDSSSSLFVDTYSWEF